MTIYTATSNPGKLRDFAAAAEAYEVSLQPLPGLAGIAPPEETEESFEGNARLKAVYYSQHQPGCWVLADDSGLEAEALDGRPGVHSANFAQQVGRLEQGVAHDRVIVDAANNEALLLAMLEQTDRRARYRCVLTLARDGVVQRTATGSVEGELLTEPRGTGGFGYDPLFWLPELGCSMAEAPIRDRLRFSHRARALHALLTAIRSTRTDGEASHSGEVTI